MKPSATLFTLAALALAACQDNAPTGLQPSASALASKGGNPKDDHPARGLTTSPGGVVPGAIGGNTSGDGTTDCRDLRAGSIAISVDSAYTRNLSEIGYRFEVYDGPGGRDDALLRFSPIAGTTASTSIVGVIVKGGPAYDVYDYTAANGTGTRAITTDNGLSSPYNRGGNLPTISHYVVCYVPYVPPPKLTKTFVGAMNAEHHFVQPMVHDGMPPMYVIDHGQTLWLLYRIEYTGAGTLTDDIQAACSALNGYMNYGVGLTCSTPGFTTNTMGMDGNGMNASGNPNALTVAGGGTAYLMIDIRNDKACGDRPFTNQAVLSVRGGGSLPATSETVWIWTPDCPK